MLTMKRKMTGTLFKIVFFFFRMAFWTATYYRSTSRCESQSSASGEDGEGKLSYLSQRTLPSQSKECLPQWSADALPCKSRGKCNDIPSPSTLFTCRRTAANSAACGGDSAPHGLAGNGAVHPLPAAGPHHNRAPCRHACLGRLWICLFICGLSGLLSHSLLCG